jgi:hypothetical protein
MGAVPDWAPPGEAHLLRSTSIVTHVEYSAGRIAWTTFDADATETLRLPTKPTSVSAGTGELTARDDMDDAGYSVQALASGGVVVRVHHRVPGEVTLVFQ